MPPKIPKLAKKTARLSKQFVAALERSNYKETQQLLQNHPQLLKEPITDQGETWSPLRFAVNRSKKKIVALLLKEHGATVDELDAREQTALFDALLQSKVDITRTLLQHGANPNQQDIHGCTPLHYVIKHPNPDEQREFIQLLLMHGANPCLGTGTHNQVTPIACALALGRHDLVELLDLSSIQKKGTAGAVPFDDAYQKLVAAFDDRALESFKQCIRQATHLVKDLGDLLSYVASLDTHPYLFVNTLLEQGVPLEPIQEGADSALIQAVARRDYPLQQLLLNCNADPNWPGQAGNTALMQAIKQGDIASVELIFSLSLHLIDPAVHCDDQGDLMTLISRQPHKIRQPIEDKLSKYIRNETNPPDKLPEIEQAVAENNFQQFKQLLDSHPNLIQRSQAQYGNRPLMAAVKNQANPMLKKLLQHGADPRLTDPEGRTPLHWAANKKLLAITQTLLNDHRTQLACLDKWGNSALWQAGVQGHPAIIQKFLEDPQRGFEANPQLGQDELYRALTAPHWRAMESFLDGGVDPDQINATGKSVWQEAAQNPNPQIMQLLLRYDRLELQDRLWWAFKQKDCPFFQQLLQHEGISLEQANPQGLVLLLVAVKNGDLDSVGQLLQANANPRCMDPQDRSALALAILSDKPQRLQIANRLLQQDASLIEQADHQGRTPLLLAAERGDQPMVDWLLQAGANSQQRDHQGKSALSLAVLSSNKQQCVPVAQQLYQENGCLINQADNKQQTPLILAAKQVFLPMIQWLLSVQADSTARDHLGRNALVVAAQSQHDSAPEMIQLLSENAFSQFDALDWAVEHDHAAVDRLIEQGIAIDQVDRHGQTLLLAVAYHGKLDAINKLLNYYPRNSLNQTNRKDQTALSYAAQRGHLDSVQALLRAGADLNLSDQQGYTPLLWALDKGHDQIALWLLQQNAELSVTCPSTGTIKSALIIAIKKNRISLINPLIEHGADLNAVDDQGFTPLYWAARLGSVASLEILLQQSTIDCNRVGGLHQRTALLWAIDKLPRADTGADAQKIIKVINLLLPHSDLNKADAQGETPLLAAINTGQRAIIKRLLADPRTAVYLEDNSQKSAINWAEEKHDQWLLGQLQAHPSYQQFRKKPLTAKKKKESDNSPRQLVLAAKKGNLELLKLLLAGGRSPDQDCAGWTPLIVAAKAGHCDIVSSLLKQGADPNRCYKGWPALLFALHYGWIEVAQLLLDQPTTQLQLGDGQNNFPLLLAAKRGQYKLVKQLLEKGADPNQQDDGPTALIAAAEAGQFACAEILLEYGADPNRWTDIGSGWGGCTALMQAVHYEHVDIVRLLINRPETFGNPVDIQGWTPLLWAIQNGYSEAAEILISSGKMDLNYPRAGDTALTLAIRERQLAIVTRLLAEPDLYCKKSPDNTMEIIRLALDCVKNSHDKPEQREKSRRIVTALVQQLSVTAPMLATLTSADKAVITPIIAQLPTAMAAMVLEDNPVATSSWKNFSSAAAACGVLLCVDVDVAGSV